MAMIKCPECQKEISDKAKQCPHCGFPIDKSDKKDHEAASAVLCTFSVLVLLAAGVIIALTVAGFIFKEESEKIASLVCAGVAALLGIFGIVFSATF